MTALPGRRHLPRHFAHRCGGRLAPENTLLGLERAAAAGFVAVEFDVMLSADGTPVLIHDETLERTTNGHGRVAASRDADLFRLDAGEGERIPTLVEAAARCLALGLFANIEIKPASGHEVETGRVVALQARALWQSLQGWQGWQGYPLLLSSFSMHALQAARAAAPQLPRGLLFEQIPEDWQAQLHAVGARTLHLHHTAVDATLLRDARAAGVPVLVYTVNAVDQAAALLRAGVAAVFTDCPDVLAA